MLTPAAKLVFSHSSSTINEILSQLFADSNIAYSIEGNQIVLSKKAQEAKKAKKTISGVIKDNNGQALIGVSVLLKESGKGTVSDINGRFKIDAAEGDLLQFSYIGYQAQSVKVGSSATMVVTMAEDSKSLNEVVVVGYGTMRKKDLTGSIAQIRPDKLADENPKTVQDILRGTPGLQVSLDPSAKGGGSIQLRGQRSLYTAGGHNEPLIILDNMPFYGELSEINPDDIGQIDILKDASAAAIYGSKAASGVIIITTKKGKEGKPVVNFTSNMGITQKSAYRNVFSPDGYMQYREDWYKKDTYGVNATTGNYEAYQTASTLSKPGYYDNPANLGNYGITTDQWKAYTTNASGESDASIYAKRLGLEGGVLNDYLAGNTFDWYKHTFRTGFNKDYNVSVSGASDKMNYYMSVGYQNNEGAVNYDNYQAIRSNLKLEGKVNKWLEISTNVNFQNRSDGGLTPELGEDYWLANQIRNSPYSHYLNTDGTLAQYPMGDGVIKRGTNYDFDRQYLDLERGYTVLNTIFNAKVKLPFNITYSFNASPRMQWYYNRYFMSAVLPDSDPKSRGVDREQNQRFDWSLNNTLAWDQTFAEKHHVSLTLVQEAEERRYWQDVINARNIQPSDALGLHNTSNGTKENSSFSSYDSHQTANGLLARAFYSYDERYMLTASIRRDGYSAFGQDNPYATFPSLALGWTFTNEKFFQWDPMSNGKLRVSYGENGNRSLADPYVMLANLITGSSTYGYMTNGGSMDEVKYLFINRMANPKFQWEKTAAFNVGLDFGFLNDRITGSVEYYAMKTHDMIMYKSLPVITGFNNIITNLGEVQSNGFDISLNSQNIKNSVFEWNTTLNFSFNKNEIKHLYYENENILDNTGNVIGTKERDDKGNGWFIDNPISAIWNYKVTGIWQANEVDEAKKYNQKPGDPKVANLYTVDDKVNADGTTTPVYNDKDKTFLGQTTPPINWQLRNDFTFYKNWNFSFNIYSFMGHKSLSTYYMNNDNGGSLITYNYNTFAKKYWTPENPSSKYARLDAQAPSGASAGKLYDRTFIRLDNISMGYSLPKTLTSKMSIEKLKIYGSVRNVAVWNKDWEYGDPETGGLATRVYSLGLNVTF
ncbi:MAG: SusC/RagA family TonB-linked outer membrane protein [Paludibacter sp.]